MIAPSTQPSTSPTQPSGKLQINDASSKKSAPTRTAPGRTTSFVKKMEQLTGRGRAAPPRRTSDISLDMGEETANINDCLSDDEVDTMFMQLEDGYYGTDNKSSDASKNDNANHNNNTINQKEKVPGTTRAPSRTGSFLASLKTTISSSAKLTTNDQTIPQNTQQEERVVITTNKDADSANWDHDADAFLWSPNGN